MSLNPRARKARKPTSACLEQLDQHVATLDERIDGKLALYREHHVRLTMIPDVDRVLVAVLIDELGTDMSVFKSGAHLAASAGVCPRNNESAGKRKRADTHKGNVHLMTGLVEAAHGAARTKGSYFKDKFFRIKARRGYLRAAVVAARLRQALPAPPEPLG
jgi:transposase